MVLFQTEEAEYKVDEKVNNPNHVMNQDCESQIRLLMEWLWWSEQHVWCFSPSEVYRVFILCR